MASGMMAGISSPARPWFRLRLAAETPPTSSPASAPGSTRCSAACCTSSPRPTSTTACTRSTASSAPSAPRALWVDEDEEDVVRGYTLTVGEYWLASLAAPRRRHALSLDVVDGAPDRRHASAATRSAPASAPTTTTASSTSNTRSSTRSSPIRTRRRSPRGLPTMDAAPGAGISPAACRSARYGSSAAQQGEHALLQGLGLRGIPRHGAALGRGRLRHLGLAARAGRRWATPAAADPAARQAARRSTSRSSRRWSAPPALRNEPASLLPGGITYVADPTGQSLPAGDRRAHRPRRTSARTSARSRAASRRPSTPTCS